jgi:hypothetical protein
LACAMHLSGSTSKRSLTAWYLSPFDIVGMARIVRYASRGDYDVPKVWWGDVRDRRGINF